MEQRFDKIIIFGTGADAGALLNEMNQNKDYYKDEIVAVCDNNQDRWHMNYFNIQVLPPIVISEMDFDYVVIATRDYHREIEMQLKTKFQLPDSKIMGVLQYRRKMNIKYQYLRNCAQLTHSVENRFFSKKIVVYTAIQGDYDDLKDPLFVDENITYVCFTENRNLKSDIWNMEYIKSDFNDNAVNIRKYKMLPHNYFPEFETSVWVDGSLLIKEDIRTLMKQYGKGSDFLCFPHEMRKCIYDEGAEVIRLRRAPKDIVIRQMAYYLEQGYPQNNGLFCGGCLIRNHKNLAVIKVMEEWWEQVNIFSKRDQISLPYVLHKNKCNFDLCDLDINNNAWLCNEGHRWIYV